MNIEEYKGVWVFIEQRDQQIVPVSLELLGSGRKLADKRGCELAGILIGHHVQGLTATLFEYGADTVYVYDDEIFSQYRTEPYMYAVNHACHRYKPEIMLYGATATGKDLASAVATDLATGLTADCTILDVDPETGLLEASRPAFGGNIMATILCKKRRPQMATVRPKVMQAADPVPGRTGSVIHERITLGADQVRTSVLEVVRKTTNRARLDEADIIVAGGKGMRDREGFQLCHRLADVLGGSVGASRDAVEAGWIDHAQQIGQTGITVTPKIYFALGISGAIQHVVGMQNAGLIIAINQDPHAPIFQVCHYGIVGDVFEVVPQLIEAFQRELSREEGQHVS